MDTQHETGTLDAVVVIACLVVSHIGMANARASATGEARPNDPLFSKQEPLFKRINVLEAWKVTKGDPNVLIGVIDHGFDFFHPDRDGACTVKKNSYSATSRTTQSKGGLSSSTL